MAGHSGHGEALWVMVAAAGQRAVAQTRSLPGHHRATAAARMAAEAVSASREMVRVLAAKVEELERRLAESRVEYRGVWKPGERYIKGQMTTSGGNIWFCNEPTTGKPGEDHVAWTLAVRRGRDGKDARP